MGLFDSVSGLFNPKPSKSAKLAKNTSNDIMGRIGPNVLNKPYKPYEGDLTASVNNLQNQGADATAGALSAYQGGAPQLKDYMSDYFNPYLEQVGAMTMRDMNQLGFDRQNDWATQAHMAGAYGDTGYGVGAGQIEGNLAQEAGDRLNQIYAGGWDEALRAAGIDANTAMQNRAGQLGAASQLYSQGTQQQGTAQHQLDALLQQWNEAQNYPERQMLLSAQIMNLLQSGDAAKGTSKGEELLGGLGTAASIATKVAPMIFGV